MMGLNDIRRRLDGWKPWDDRPVGRAGASLSLRRPVWRRPATWSLALGIVLALAAAGAAGWYYYSLTPADPGAPARRVVIAKGETPSGIARQLQREGIIRNRQAFRLYIKLSGVQNHLKAGAYALSPSMSARTVADYLYQGRVTPLKITILPGLTLNELSDELRTYGFDRADIQASLSAAYQSQLFADKPAGTSLEGYVFPDTYEILPGDSVRSLLSKSFEQFSRQLAASDLTARLQSRGLNLYQAITLASIVQQEVGDPAEQKKVAMVFENRLKAGMTLGADVTFIYAAKQLGVAPSANLNSPYNTRINKGLPPGPIGNFNLSALEAVASPAPGDYFYFVAGDDKVIHYARTLAEHEQNIKNYCKKQCQ